MYWFVSRHLGAVAWLARQGIKVDRQVEHLNIDQVQAGDWVVGNLPVNLAAKVCQRNAVYVHLSLNVPAHARGRELSAEELDAYGAHLQVYTVTIGGRQDRSNPVSTQSSCSASILKA